MCEVCGFALLSGQIKVKAEKPEEKKNQTNLGVKVLGFDLSALPEVQQEMQCFIGTSTESV